MVGKENVDIIFIFEKIITLTYVLRVPDMNRNSISRNLLEKWGIKCVYVSEKLILSRKKKFVREGYSWERKWSNCVPLTLLIIIKLIFLTWFFFFTLWHAKLGHIDASATKRMLNFDIISYDVNNAYKGKTHVESKTARKLYICVNMTSHYNLFIQTYMN